ncbi:MAG: Transcriptional regulator [Lachnoclostridium sp.]|jgi:uncharacterized phage-associated protein
MEKNNLQNNSNSIVTSAEIRKILSDFRIGKKPLAKLLGWGETTIIRYIEGDIPTAEYSNKLKAIAQDPAYYYKLLLENKDNLTNVAFRKSLKAVMDKLTEKKINLVAQYLIYTCQGDLSPWYIQCLLYYSQGFSLALFDKELFEDDYGVNQENVPYYELYSSMKKHGINVFEVPEVRFTKDEIALLRKIIDAFCWYGPKALKAMTLAERLNFKISRDKEGRKIISKEHIKNYFKGLLTQYDIKSVNDIHNYPDRKFLECKSL